MKKLKLFTILGLLILFYSCDPLEGKTYVGQDGAYLEKMTFKSNNKVELVRFGSAVEGTYTMDGDQVKIDTEGENQILTITDEGCLDGGGFIGKYCKE